jgi:hypothetical protein
MRERRYNFSDKTKREAWARCDGLCEGCANPIRAGNGPEYHHRYLPATEPGSDYLENCMVLCSRPCHRVITDTETTPKRAKTKRVSDKRIGLRQTRQGFRGWRRMDGTPVWKR